MEHVRLGDSGLKVSRFCLGTMSYGDPSWWEWVLDEDAATPIIERAAEAEVNFFDTADAYSGGMSEELTGRVLRKIFPRREDFVLATKVSFPTGPGPNDLGLSRKHIMAAVDASLARLGTDYIDLYQVHRWDPTTPIEETMRALHDLVSVGKVRYLGASSMYAWQFAKAQHLADLHGWTPFTSMQNLYNLLYREEEREMIPYCLDRGVGIIPWSPMARGLLARRPGSAATARRRSDPLIDAHYEGHEPRILDHVTAIAESRGVPPAQIALAWLLSKPGVVAPIVGATRKEHIEDAIAATELRLTPEEIARLEQDYRPRPVQGIG